MEERRRLGKHRLLRRLAVGGMAEVYLAVAEGPSGFAKRVVVKRLLPQHARDADIVAMFLDEARLLAALAHRNIAEVYDIGEEGGEHYFAMEYVAGRDLREVLHALGGAALPLAEAVAIAGAVATALHHAHEQRDGDGHLLGIVHRDVSPSNVLVSAAGEIKLIDFGVAKWAAQRSETQHGVLKGKCAYMSPEQCRAEPLDRRSDVFALGVLLYELTTGAKPFDGVTDFEVLNAIVRGAVEPATRRRPDYPHALEAITLRALRAQREERYQTAEELARDLARVSDETGLVASEASLRALLERLFGPTPAEPGEPLGNETSGPHAAPTPSRPVERTATDVHAAGARAPARAPRRQIAVAVAVAALALVAAGGVWLARAASRSAPVVTVSQPPTPAAPVPTAPPASSTVPDAQSQTVAEPLSTPRAPKEARKLRAMPRSAMPVKVWDPDSPVPP